MRPDAPELTKPKGTPADQRRVRLRSQLLVLAFLCGVGALAVLLGHRFANSAVIDLGPTDARYVRDFRDLERDGPVYFRWSSVPSSTLSLPVRFCGPGLLRLRVRRHFVDPATLSVSVGGAVLGQRSVQARSDHPYDVLEFQVSKSTCVSNAVVLLESTVENDRPLGVAVDWVEIRSPQGFRAPPATILRGALFLGMSALAILLAGGGIPITLATTGILSGLMGFAFAAGPVGAERLLRGGLVALALTLLMGVAIARPMGIFTLQARYRTALVLITLFTLLSRSAFLHTQAFYPDYRVHALVQQTLNRVGLSTFLDQLFEVQYARSLGLQQIGGNWYPFPYPPGAYAVTSGVASLSGLDPLDASIVTAVTAASLIPILTLALGIALGFGEFVGLSGAFYVALQPLLVRRMALGYFPGLVGQCVDAVALLLFLAAFQPSRVALRRAVLLTLALLAAFLVYTQSIVNFGLLIAALLFIEIWRKSPGGRKGAVRVALAGILAVAASAGVFYWRYLPVLENVMSHRPQPEARVLDRLEQLRQSPASAEDTPETDDLNDPYAGYTLNPIRGLARLGSRLWRFNGPFVLALAIGSGLLWRSSTRSTRNIMVAWGGVAVWISLLAAGLPSPNGFQHLKDLEFVSPLAALAMGALTRRLWEWRPLASVALAVAWIGFAGMAFMTELTDRFLPLIGH